MGEALSTGLLLQQLNIGLLPEGKRKGKLLLPLDLLLPSPHVSMTSTDTTPQNKHCRSKAWLPLQERKHESLPYLTTKIWAQLGIHFLASWDKA